MTFKLTEGQTDRVIPL